MRQTPSFTLKKDFDGLKKGIVFTKIPMTELFAPEGSYINTFTEEYIRTKTDLFEETKEPRGIEVSDFWRSSPFEYGITTYAINVKGALIPKEKYAAIKQAIENVLNGFNQEELIRMGKEILMEGHYSVKDMEDCFNSARVYDEVIFGQKNFKEYLRSLDK